MGGKVGTGWFSDNDRVAHAGTFTEAAGHHDVRLDMENQYQEMASMCNLGYFESYKSHSEFETCDKAHYTK